MPENSESIPSSLEYACVFCHSGSEEQLVREINDRFPFMEALSPAKMRYRHVNGKPVEEQITLFPGYLFVRLRDDGSPYQLTRNGMIYRLLQYSDGNWRLQGSDRAFAETLFSMGGVFGFSQAFYENDRIHIVDGPLKAYDGKILRVNHRKRTAQVQISFSHMNDMTVWLGFELIEKQDHP